MDDTLSRQCKGDAMIGDYTSSVSRDNTHATDQDVGDEQHLSESLVHIAERSSLTVALSNQISFTQAIEWSPPCPSRDRSGRTGPHHSSANEPNNNAVSSTSLGTPLTCTEPGTYDRHKQPIRLLLGIQAQATVHRDESTLTVPRFSGPSAPYTFEDVTPTVTFSLLYVFLHACVQVLQNPSTRPNQPPSPPPTNPYPTPIYQSKLETADVHTSLSGRTMLVA
jgi:hypothetical protein